MILLSMVDSCHRHCGAVIKSLPNMGTFWKLPLETLGTLNGAAGFELRIPQNYGVASHDSTRYNTNSV